MNLIVLYSDEFVCIDDVVSSWNKRLFFTNQIILFLTWAIYNYTDQHKTSLGWSFLLFVLFWFSMQILIFEVWACRFFCWVLKLIRCAVKRPLKQQCQVIFIRFIHFIAWFITWIKLKIGWRVKCLTDWNRKELIWNSFVNYFHQIIGIIALK